MRRLTHAERAELPVLRALAGGAEVARDPRDRALARVLRRERDPGEAGRLSPQPSSLAPLEPTRDPAEAGLQLPALAVLLLPLGDPRVFPAGGHRRVSASHRAHRRGAACRGRGEGPRGAVGADGGGRREEHAVPVERRVRRGGDAGSPQRTHLGREVEPSDERGRHRRRRRDGEDLELREERSRAGGALGEPERRLLGGRASHVRTAGGLGLLRRLRPALQRAAEVLREGRLPPRVRPRNTPRTTPPSPPSRSIPREICSSRGGRTVDWPPGMS